ncbi:MAG: signal peptide peptidase SppA [Deltaproteobacteria bacterium]|nr:signal peptide peptidase SppA [Deltaproteobacteria bacterium]
MSLRPAALLVALSLVGRVAHAQPIDRRYAAAPTDGIELPVTPRAGEADARAVTVNPASLWFLHGTHAALALGVADPDRADRGGAGAGFFLGGSVGGGFLPRLAWGAALELVRSPRAAVLPDPGSPVRLSAAAALPLPIAPLGAKVALGAVWHHAWDDGALGGLDTWDLGASARFGAHVAAAAVVRDLNRPTVAGAPVERRYELELGVRPTGTERLDLGLGGRVDEHTGDLDGWLRASVKVTRGVFVHAAVETRALNVTEITPTGTIASNDRDVRGTLGLELSFGNTGLTAYGSAGRDGGGGLRDLGCVAIARWSSDEVPGVQGRETRIERIELTGGIGSRELVSLVLRMRAIARDPDVVGVVVALDGVAAGWATLQDLRGELLRLHAAGKKTFAYLVAGSSRDYWIATACDKIYVDPAGGLRLVGLAGTTLYFKGAFDQLGVQAQFEKIAEYKSAPESYTDVGPSEPALRMRNELYDSIWGQVVSSIAQARHLDGATVQQLVDNGPYTAGDLMKEPRLVDGVGMPDKISELVVKELGGAYTVGSAPATRAESWQLPALAIIYVDGDIIDGPSRSLPIAIPLPFVSQEMAGSETVSAAIAAARANPRVKAIVLRVDSPGGSAVASDLIAREIKATRGVKPIICSMGDLAASGGYFVSAYCDWIVAEPTTITGSIGIFTGKFDLSGLFGKLGITFETFKRGAHADMEAYFRPFTDEERATIHEKLKYLYGRFTGAVAEGRKLTEAKVDEVGRGHVWSGAMAKGVGLVDQLGGIGDAIDLAKQKAGYGPDDHLALVELPKQSSGLLGQLLGPLGRERAGLPATLGTVGISPLLDAVLAALPLSVLAEPAVPQARLEWNVRWE